MTDEIIFITAANSAVRVQRHSRIAALEARNVAQQAAAQARLAAANADILAAEAELAQLRASIQTDEVFIPEGEYTSSELQAVVADLTGIALASDGASLQAQERLSVVAPALGLLDRTTLDAAASAPLQHPVGTGAAAFELAEYQAVGTGATVARHHDATVFRGTVRFSAAAFNARGGGFFLRGLTGEGVRTLQDLYASGLSVALYGRGAPPAARRGMAGILKSAIRKSRGPVFKTDEPGDATFSKSIVKNLRDLLHEAPVKLSEIMNSDAFLASLRASAEASAAYPTLRGRNLASRPCCTCCDLLCPSVCDCCCCRCIPFDLDVRAGDRVAVGFALETGTNDGTLGNRGEPERQIVLELTLRFV